MNRLLRLTVLHVWQEILNWSGGWWFAATLAAQETIGPLVGLFVWTQVFPGDPRIAGYYVALVGVQLMTASYEGHTFSNTVYEGTVSHALLQPKPIVIGPVAVNIAIRSWLMLIGLPVVAVTALGLGTSYAPIDIVAAVPAVLLAGVVKFLWTWLLALTAFWTERAHAVVGFGTLAIFLLGGSAAPVAVLAEPLRSIARALPFRAMLGFPAELATGGLNGTQAAAGFAWQAGWIGVLGVFAVFGWLAGIRRYSAVGG